MEAPRTSRPYMPGYGVLGPGEGTGLLPWAWAEERLQSSRDYWIATVRAEGRPHLMPVWGIWHRDMLWFSSSNGSRKSRNLAENARCAAATEDAESPVVVEGTVQQVCAPHVIALYADLVDAKYVTSYGPGFYDTSVNSVFQLRPEVAFGISGDDFTGSPTRWICESAEA